MLENDYKFNKTAGQGDYCQPISLMLLWMCNWKRIRETLAKPVPCCAITIIVIQPCILLNVDWSNWGNAWRRHGFWQCIL